MIGSLDTIDIGSVVTDDDLLDFLILYESLVESWTAYPFVLHAFLVEDRVARRLASAGLENLQIHRLPPKAAASHEPGAPAIELIEHSGLERCIVTNPDNVFLAEVPELWFLLDGRDFLFVGGPSGERPIQTSVWSFRRTGRSVEFARRWEARSAGVDASDSSRLLGELVSAEGAGMAVKVLAPPASPGNPDRSSNPYGVDAGLLRAALEQDPLGFREQGAGRVKVVHFAGLGGSGNRSLTDRIDAVVERFPQTAPMLPFYATLVRRAALRLGIDVVGNARVLVRDRLLEAGVLATRNWLPELLNRRGLGGLGVEVGVRRGRFSEMILRTWRGRMLISVDSWLEAPPDEYVDVANVTQAEHERFYEDAVERLQEFGERSEIWRMTSTEAAARIEPHSLDFVYLDARHDYRSVMEDLEYWFEKLRPGGIFAGHDYVDGLLPVGLFGVKSAVDEFFGARGLTVKQTYVEGFRGGPPASWLVEIPASAPF